MKLIKFVAIFLFINALNLYASLDSKESFSLMDLYDRFEVGDWIQLKTAKDTVSMTTVQKKIDHKLVLEIKTFVNHEIQSISYQTINLMTDKIELIEVFQDDRKMVMKNPQSDWIDFMSTSLVFEQTESLKVNHQVLECDQYRTIFNDYVVKIWFHPNVCLFGIVKLKSKGMLIEVLDWGKQETASVLS